ncbi:sugar phosphate isomerase/epimerase family protein [Paludisphaera rhizosphaerae]|uniref:sugar phosphate isomerase/epimerase family protein n=1 Tax=Paludisphaera rhizosphaerae TaxID=2711216 RepID=UPI0013E9FA9A|nr:sugar phosphate isomerase/epimerase [Paludisphaera rhizosphaerae]
MFVACSTLCFANEPLESALRHIAELEFDKYELAVVEGGRHLRPSEVGEDPESALLGLKRGPALIPSSLYMDFGPVDWSDPVQKKRFDNHCRFAKGLSVAVLTLTAAPAGTPFEQEVKRLTALSATAMREGLVLAMLTHREAITGDPVAALRLCKAVPGLALTLDPSHFIGGGVKESDVDQLFPYVQNTHLRDTGKNAGEFQVRIGQGQIEYARIANLLNRAGYNRALTVAILDLPENNFDREVEVRKLRLLLETLL